MLTHSALARIPQCSKASSSLPRRMGASCLNYAWLISLSHALVTPHSTASEAKLIAW